MIFSLNGEGGGQFSQPILIPALSQRLSQLSLSPSDKDKYQQLRTACHASKSDNNTLSELTRKHPSGANQLLAMTKPWVVLIR